MGQPLFAQNVVAVIWDFDKTLTPAYMQAPLFKRYEVDETKFWKEVNGLEILYRERGAKNVSKDSLYLNHILTYVRAGIFKDLSNKILFELGAQIDFYEGMPDALAKLKQFVEENERFRKHEITVEHYVVSTGLRQMIMGSAVAEHVKGVWGCEFVEGAVSPHYLDEPPQKNLFTASSSGVITDIAYSIDNTTKTRALFEINKGANLHSEIQVNSTLAVTDRRVPFQNMIYVADGPSDVPAFSIVNQYGGQTFGVYKPREVNQFKQINQLQRENRVQGIGEASYVDGSQTFLWLSDAVELVSTKIANAREAVLRERAGFVPQHILKESIKSNTAGPTLPAAAVPAAAAIERKAPASASSSALLPSASERVG